MNLAIFWRLLWKEYRLQRALWIAMAVLTTLLLWLMGDLMSHDPQKVQRLFGLAVGLSAFYALGCGATLFAGEQEAGTYEFQRALPLSAMRLLAGKMVFALLSSALLFGLTWSLAAFLSGWTLPPAHEHLAVWAIYGFFGLEMLVWATFFSLLLRQVLMAAILGVAAASLSAHIAGSLINPQFADYLTAMPYRAAVVLLVAMADLWLGSRWLREGGARLRRGSSATASQQQLGIACEREVAHERAGANRLRGPERMAIVWRLVWQQWRQSAWMTLTLGSLTIPLALITVQMWMSTNVGATSLLRNPEMAAFYLAVVLPLVTIPLVGACVFLGDQRQRSFRFLADRGVPPRYIWLSRQFGALAATIVLAAVILVGLLLLLLLAYSAAWNLSLVRRLSSNVAVLNEVTHVLALGFALGCYVVLGITAGQFCSMLFRSGILAGFFSIVLTCLLWGWCGLMWLWGVNWLWSVAPIPLVLLWATWLRTPHWLLERNDPRAWLAPALAVLVPAACILTAVPWVRIHGIPVVDPGFSPEQFARPRTPQEQATLDLYERAHQEYIRPAEKPSTGNEDLEQSEKLQQPKPLVLTPEEIAWIDANQKAIALTLEASRRKDCDFFDPAFLRSRQHDVVELARLLVFSAAKVEHEGNLDEAIERYLAAIRISLQLRHRSWSWHHADLTERMTYARLPYWAARPNQTPERILAAARQLVQLTANVPAASDVIKSEHVRVQRCLAGDPNEIRGGGNPWMPVTMLWLKLPWERARALRLLNLLTRQQLDEASAAESAAHRGERILQPRRGGWFYDERERELPYALHQAIDVPPIEYDTREGARAVQDYTQMETFRRAMRLVLALEAWKRKHGSLPERLDELLGEYLDRLPVDPYSAAPFRWCRDGLKIPLHHRYARGDIAADTPFVWATGAEIHYNEKEEHSPYSIYTDPWSDRRHTRLPNSEYDLWESGWPFPIP